MNKDNIILCLCFLTALFAFWNSPDHKGEKPFTSVISCGLFPSAVLAEPAGNRGNFFPVYTLEMGLSPSTFLDKDRQAALLMDTHKQKLAGFIEEGNWQEIGRALKANDRTALIRAFESSELLAKLKEMIAYPATAAMEAKTQFHLVENAFLVESWFEEAERTNDLDALQDHLNTKSVEKDGLTGESLQKLLQLYRHLNPSQREALRFAYIFRQSSSVLNLGKDAYKSAEIIEPALQVLVEKEVITADQKNLILALISQHEDFNTTQYGESVPPRIGDYLTEKGLEVSDYYGPASFMYVVDHSGTQAGILTNSMLENADWLSHEEHIASLFAHWEKVRWLEGFRGKGATPIPLAQLTQLEAYELPAFIREELDSAGPREYALTFEQMLRKKMSFVGWAYHFLRRLGDLDEHSLLRFLYLNSKIFEFFEKKGRPLHILKFLIMEKNLAHIQENAEFSHAVFQDTTCADMAEFFHEAYADETALLEAVQERFHLRFVYSGDTLLLDWNNVYSGMEGSALSRFPVTQKILGKAS